MPNLETIFDEAIKLGSPAARAAYLEEACEGDGLIRQQAERLIADYFRAGDFLQRPVAAITEMLDHPAIVPGVGSKVGRYKLLEQIGEGGMGVVFVAEQMEPVRRHVALKIIKPGMDTRQVIARFEAERQALAIMDHSNIARVLDAGTTDEGRPYFVMELVRGMPITDYCDKARLEPRKRLELFVTVCQAVQHAHQKGIIHRDLKPSNILITLHDGAPVVKVIDFGVAKAIGQQLTEASVYTGLTQLIGTPLYMSPEQAEMSGLDIDTRSDIYSLGVLLYELLTGQTPFDREMLAKAGLDEMRRLIREEEPLRPSQRLSSLGEQALSTVSQHRGLDERRLGQLLRGELDWIVMKALEKDRGLRYETASSFAADVQRYLNDEQVQACPPAVLYRFQKLVRRNRATLATCLLIAVVLLVATIASTWQAMRAMQAGAIANQDREKALSAASAERTAREDAVIARQEAEANFDLALAAVNRYFVQVSDSPQLKAVGLETLRRDLLLSIKPFYEQFTNQRRDDPRLQEQLALARERLALLSRAMVGDATSGDDVKRCRVAALRLDAVGNVYVAGQLWGTVDFDPGQGTVNLTSAGSGDIFIVKFAQDGSLLWAQCWGGHDQDDVGGMSLDNSGNAYLTGYFKGRLRFGSTTLVSTGPNGNHNTSYVAKIDGVTGEVLWAIGMGGGIVGSTGRLVVDPRPGFNGLWVAGSFTGPGTFGSITLPGAGNSDVRNSDIVITRLNRDTGAVEWAGQMGGPGIEHAFGIDVDKADGSVYIAGQLTALPGVSTADLDPGAAVFELTYNSANARIGLPWAFLAKLDSAGVFQWAKSIEGKGEGIQDEIALPVISVDDGQISLTVSLAGGTVDLDPGPGVANVKGFGAIAKYTSDGDLLWARGSEASITNHDLDADGNVYICGSFAGTIDVDPGPGIFHLTAAGSRSDSGNGLVAKLDAYGDLTWARRMGGENYASANRIAIDTSGNVYVAGTFRTELSIQSVNSADLPTGDTFIGAGMFISKLEQLPNGLLSVATITGRVFNDENQNELIDDCITFPSRTVYLDTDNDGQLDPGEHSTRSYANGVYSLNGLGAGTNHVRQVVPPGWSLTTPASQVHEVTVDFRANRDQLFVGRDFGNVTLTPQTKFYVVCDDPGGAKIYEHAACGKPVKDYTLSSENMAPRGAATTAAGTRVWVVDANGRVYIYNSHGSLVGSWTAGSLPEQSQLEGIATDGTDVWLVDNESDKVYRYTDAASRLSGSHAASSSFALHRSFNNNPKDIVTDGQWVWVVDDKGPVYERSREDRGLSKRVNQSAPNQDKVVKYTVSGKFVDSWGLDATNQSPTGLTIDLSSGSSDIWVVDCDTQKVYQYAGGRLGGAAFRKADYVFSLAPGSSNPQGIAAQQ